MPAPVVPWEPCNIPGELQDEFNRRKINRSFRYVKAEMGEWASTTGDWSKYRGPMSPWVRFCSNSRGKQYQTDRNGNIATDEKGNSIALDSSQRKEGFILFGGKGFYADYGFTKSKDNPSIIGYVPDNVIYGGIDIGAFIECAGAVVGAAFYGLHEYKLFHPRYRI